MSTALATLCFKGLLPIIITSLLIIDILLRLNQNEFQCITVIYTNAEHNLTMDETLPKQIQKEMLPLQILSAPILPPTMSNDSINGETNSDRFSTKHKCKFKGKVFNLGLSKTGTQTMTDILRNELGYKCNKSSPLLTCGYNPLWLYMKDAMLPLFVATEDLSWIWHSKPFHHDLIESISNSNVFGDAPWTYLYPIYDQLLPQNATKFILTIRDSTRDQVNSNMKMFARQQIVQLKRRGTFNVTEDIQYDYTNFTSAETLPGWPSVERSWTNYWTLDARNYEIHNSKVIEYFKKRGRLKDLLVINLGEQSKKWPYSEQWYPITDFLGCSNITDKPLTRKNSATEKVKDNKWMKYQIEFFPKDYMIHYENYSWPKTINEIFEIVQNMSGKYDEKAWTMLKDKYRIYEKKLNGNK